jgi:coproporphyrinogen III oxidase
MACFLLRCLARSVGGTVLLALIATVAHAAADDDKLQKLPPEKRAQAEFLNAFADRMDRKYFGRVGELNGAAPIEDRSFSTEWGDLDVRVTRGKIIEKAGRLYAMGKKQRPARGGREIAWSRFYALDIHPKNPLVGMLHAAIVLEFYGDGTALAGGWVDVMPGTRIEEDLARLDTVTKDYFAERKVDLTIYRQLVCKGTSDTVRQFRRRPACVGASFYGPPVYPDTHRSLEFIAGLYEAYTDAYLDIAAKRAGDPFTEADLRAQDQMRRNWFTDQVFSDPYSSVEIPFEAHTLWNAAPTVRF